MMDHRRPHLLRNQDNKSVVVLFQKMMLVEEIPYTAENYWFDKRPIFLIKESRKAIRTWGFGSTNTTN
jgi:hypothetical protein